MQHNEPDDRSTRQRVIDSVLQHGPSTATQLAGRLELTPAAIRRHLTALLLDGTLLDSEQRVYGARGRGRPSKVFSLTDLGRSEFHHTYDALAISAMRRLRDTAGADAVRELAAERLDGVEQRFHEMRAAHPERPAVDVLADSLAVNGYAPAVKPVASGDQLCQHHCPVAHVAAEFPILCEVETALFARLLGSHVQRLATIAHGDGVCTTHVPHPVTTKSIATSRK
ncbi:helix-turn-helix transcriptional regulator [Tessaracoccus antarcticus]|uniref:ArsR family transcriptional regulator n=1 Tax=Tessaracoccus antarcticus TaxID=2479848 RepID=A0A3M0G4G7_9ACTN|nr:ArsR family transcriptional regulator [Tessaracoccus antarcticus]RMB59734.1 ArsR family transcriptional regulator [Tessaracoccus antarcticus]